MPNEIIFFCGAGLLLMVLGLFLTRRPHSFSKDGSLYVDKEGYAGILIFAIGAILFVPMMPVLISFALTPS